MDWPHAAESLRDLQQRVGEERPTAWDLPEHPLIAAGVFVCFPRGLRGPGAAGDPAWIGAALTRDAHCIREQAATGRPRAPYEPGLLALREGPLLAAAVMALPIRPDVVVVNATGRDHPRGAGLALHLGAILDLATVGVTHRPLIAEGLRPPDRAGATTPTCLEGAEVGVWWRPRAGVRPIAVHAAWRTETATALAVIRRVAGGARTPAPLRCARRAARRARAESTH